MDQCIFCKLLSDHTAKMVYEDEFTFTLSILEEPYGSCIMVP